MFWDGSVLLAYVTGTVDVGGERVSLWRWDLVGGRRGGANSAPPPQALRTGLERGTQNASRL